MAIPLGTENKRQVYLLASLFVLILCIGGWEVHGNSSSSAASARRVTVPQAAAQHTSMAVITRTASISSAVAGPEARKLGATGPIATLNFDKLAQSEQVEYEGAGRNIFSEDSVPIKIETPIKSPHIDPSVVIAPAIPPPPPPPPPPAINLKYFGYSQAKDKPVQALLVHGDDMFIAHSGEIVDHRYRVGAILPGSVEVTDLSYNNTQRLPLKAN
jgi:hypothetical protein